MIHKRGLTVEALFSVLSVIYVPFSVFKAPTSSFVYSAFLKPNVLFFMEFPTDG